KCGKSSLVAFRGCRPSPARRGWACARYPPAFRDRAPAVMPAKVGIHERQRAQASPQTPATPVAAAFRSVWQAPPLRPAVSRPGKPGLETATTSLLVEVEPAGVRHQQLLLQFGFGREQRDEIDEISVVRHDLHVRMRPVRAPDHAI